MDSDETQSLLLKPNGLIQGFSYSAQKRRENVQNQFVAHKFLEMPPSYESACGGMSEEASWFNGVPLGKNSFVDQTFVFKEVGINHDNMINERLISSLTPHHGNSNTYSQYPSNFPSTSMPSQIVKQSMNVSDYAQEIGASCNSHQGFDFNASYPVFQMKGMQGSEQFHDFSQSSRSPDGSNRLLNTYCQQASPPSENSRTSSMESKFSIRNSLKKLAVQSSQKSNKKTNKKKVSANIPLSPAHVQILVNQQNQHLQQNGIVFPHLQTSNQLLQDFQQPYQSQSSQQPYQSQSSQHQQLNSLLMPHASFQNHPGMLTACLVPPNSSHFDPYPTPSPDSPGIWSNSSPVSGKSDHWSDPVSSPSNQTFTNLSACALTRIPQDE